MSAKNTQGPMERLQMTRDNYVHVKAISPQRASSETQGWLIGKCYLRAKSLHSLHGENC